MTPILFLIIAALVGGPWLVLGFLAAIQSGMDAPAKPYRRNLDKYMDLDQ
jgi:hypothetical protein